MKKWLTSRPAALLLSALLLIAAGIKSFSVIGLADRPAEGYDEKMWTSASVSSWAMFAKGHVRQPNALDNWFPTYAWENKVDVFTGEKWEQFSPDTVKFPYDYVTLKSENKGYSQLVKYDTLAFPRSDYQWFDNALWTFGWKAPNLGKFLMGAYIYARCAAVNPNGYFKFETPEGKPSSAPFAYSPSDQIYAARQVNALFTFGIFALLLWIGFLLKQPLAGALASLLLLFNTAFFDVHTAVGLDSFVVFFSLLSFALFLKWQAAFAAKSALTFQLLWSLGLGLSLGAAVASKLNGAMAVVSTLPMYSFLLYSVWSDKARLKQLLMGGGITAGSMLLLFIALNPQIRPQPYARSKAMQQSVDGYFEKRATALTIDSASKRINLLFNALNPLIQSGKLTRENAEQLAGQLNGIGTRMKSDETAGRLTETIDAHWKSMMEVQNDLEKLVPDSSYGGKTFYNWVAIKNNFAPAFELTARRIWIRSSTEERYYGSLGSWLNFSYNPLDLLLLLGGLGSVYWLRRRYTGTHALAAVSLLVAAALTMYGNINFLWQDWTRYFTPLLPWAGLLAGLGLSAWLLPEPAGKETAKPAPAKVQSHPSPQKSGSKQGKNTKK